jgi:hypothetical protein
VRSHSGNNPRVPDNGRPTAKCTTGTASQPTAPARRIADGPGVRATDCTEDAKRTDLQSILILGSRPIFIGQAAEFGYSGTQAVRALREEGYRVILVNSNPAAITTDRCT